jgi:hypothetical protein
MLSTNWSTVMVATYWHKQTLDTPLFPDLLWSKPENKAQAGKLLIVGGNVHAFTAPANAYQAAQAAGAGSIRVLLPDALKASLGKIITFADYVPSTPSGSFSQKALADLLDQAAWADAVLLAGDFGRNSETAILIEKFLLGYSGPVVLTKDSIEYLSFNPASIRKRPQTILVLSLSQLQRLLVALRSPLAVSLNRPLIQIVETLHELTATFPFAITTKHHDHLITALAGNVATTAVTPGDVWSVDTAARSSVWLMQNPSKPFAALATAHLPLQE